MGRKEYENRERSNGPNTAKYDSRSAEFKQMNKQNEKNGKDKFKNTTI